MYICRFDKGLYYSLERVQNIFAQEYPFYCIIKILRTSNTSNLDKKVKMTESHLTFLENSSLVKVFEGVGSMGAIFVCQTCEARDQTLLKQNHIQAVLTAQKQEWISVQSSQVKAYLYLQMQDHIDFNIAPFLQSSFKFIDQNRRLTNILVHCSSGFNCSISLVIGYLVKKYQYTYQQSINLIKRRYQGFNANEFNHGFAHQLEYWAVRNGDFNNLIRQNHLRRRIERTNKTLDNIIRTYTKELTAQQKLFIGCSSPGKYNGKLKSRPLSLITNNSSSIRNDSFSRLAFRHNPEEESTISNYPFNSNYKKFLPQKSDDQIQDQDHQIKIASQIISLTQQTKMLRSKKLELLNSDTSAMRNYNRLKNSKKKHLTFYSPLKKYEKYEMFTQNKLNSQYEAIIDLQI